MAPGGGTAAMSRMMPNAASAAGGLAFIRTAWMAVDATLASLECDTVDIQK
jgi:hypothetical protein